MGLVFEPLDHVLGNRAKVRLLRALHASDAEMSVREAARIAQISHVAALKPLDELAFMGIVHRKLAGRQHLYRLNHDNPLNASLAELFQGERLRTDRLFERIRDIATRAAGDDLVGAYLIGSAVLGADKPGSDLDLLVLVARGGNAEDVMEEIASAAPALREELAVSLSPIVLLRSRFRTMYREQSGFAQAAVRGSRVIGGPTLQEIVRGRT
ncbi:MAG: nucleotidyltransferase domain-containing protein [Gemmatimonadota bacterium]